MFAGLCYCLLNGCGYGPCLQLILMGESLVLLNIVDPFMVFWASYDS